ncbi:CCA tRNA nucleotidyltransferase [Ilyobacter polytropus]|uniref:Polynucleotide adenylyltransferase region n=1 Tax=Ilyobacter polytropus (strain ATCC 51220 / DSM 2926 / LMG 16218 / CuHBu1) TaxID=572544 RepID=E3HAN0_ILYPC|nr:CCA tRNA nucleotidyltransferase [Ilyobacter polytropus]ADO83217.1 Polynucleotide adenylyltransferase region [Ilyobacter polytropus DSM 2926]
MYRKLIKEIWENNGEAYLVGGWVRDRLMGATEDEIKDIDLEVMGIKRDKFEKILQKYGKFKKVGKSYEIYILNNSIEISFIEVKIPIKECARRRDFTVNSIYYNLIEDKYLDFFGGMEDIKNKLLSYVDKNSFLQDPLRILRTAQFISRFGFSADHLLEVIIKTEKEEISKVPKERICRELEKIYMLGIKPSEGFLFLEKTGILQRIMPEISSLKEVMQDEIYHPEGDVFTHTMMMLDVLSKEERTRELFWSILYHDAGKKETFPGFEGHCEKSHEIFDREIIKFTDNRDLINNARKLVRYHEEPLKILLKGGADKISVKKLAAKVDIDKLLKLYRCDVLGRGRSDNKKELEIIESIGAVYHRVKDELKPIVKGKDLIKWGLEPGENFGEILKELYEAQLEEEFNNLKEAEEFYFTRLAGGLVYKGI